MATTRQDLGLGIALEKAAATALFAIAVVDFSGVGDAVGFDSFCSVLVGLIGSSPVTWVAGGFGRRRRNVRGRGRCVCRALYDGRWQCRVAGQILLDHLLGIADGARQQHLGDVVRKEAG